MILPSGSHILGTVSCCLHGDDSECTVGQWQKESGGEEREKEGGKEEEKKERKKEAKSNSRAPAYPGFIWLYLNQRLTLFRGTPLPDVERMTL